MAAEVEGEGELHVGQEDEAFDLAEERGWLAGAASAWRVWGWLFHVELRARVVSNGTIVRAPDWPWAWERG